MLLFSKVKWSPGLWLRQRCRDQNHHEDNLPRRSHPEARQLREGLALCVLRLQTSGLQVAQADGLQGETGKVIFTSFGRRWKNPQHRGTITHSTKSLLSATSQLEFLFNCLPKAVVLGFFFKKNHTWSHLYTHIITVYCGKFLLWLPKYVWMFDLHVFFWTSAIWLITFCTFPPVDEQVVFIVWLSGQIYSVYTADKSQGSHQLLIFYHSLFKNDKKNPGGTCHVEWLSGCNSGPDQLVANEYIYCYSHVWCHVVSLFSLWLLPKGTHVS